MTPVPNPRRMTHAPLRRGAHRGRRTPEGVTRDELRCARRPTSTRGRGSRCTKPVTGQARVPGSETMSANGAWVRRHGTRAKHFESSENVPAGTPVAHAYLHCPRRSLQLSGLRTIRRRRWNDVLVPADAVDATKIRQEAPTVGPSAPVNLSARSTSARRPSANAGRRRCPPRCSTLRISTLPDVSRLDRVTSDPSVCHGTRTTRGLHDPVENILDLLAGPDHRRRGPGRPQPSISFLVSLGCRSGRGCLSLALDPREC